MPQRSELAAGLGRPLRSACLRRGRLKYIDSFRVARMEGPRGAVPWHASALLAVAMTLACVPARATGTPDPPVLRYRDQRLTVRLHHVPLDEVVQLFARETGAEIHGEPVDLREVTKRFDSVPVPEALGRLLGAQ